MLEKLNLNINEENCDLSRANVKTISINERMLNVNNSINLKYRKEGMLNRNIDLINTNHIINLNETLTISNSVINRNKDYSLNAYSNENLQKEEIDTDNYNNSNNTLILKSSTKAFTKGDTIGELKSNNLSQKDVSNLFYNNYHKIYHSENKISFNLKELNEVKIILLIN